MRDQPIRIVFFGDSISVGQYVSVHRGWVSQLSRRLTALAEERGASVRVANASVNGNTTRLALERMPQDVQKDGVDLLVVQFGLNDCNYWQTDGGVPRVSPRAFAANLEEIVARGYRFGAGSVVLATNHPSGRDLHPMSPTGEPYQAGNVRYNAIIREVAGALAGRVVLADVEAAFLERTAGRRESLLPLLLPDPDLLHLSGRGHDVYVEILGPVLERELEKLIAVRAAEAGVTATPGPR